MGNKALELLRRARPYLSNHSGFSVTNAVYVSPAQSMRNAADDIEREVALIREIDEFLAAPKE